MRTNFTLCLSLFPVFVFGNDFASKDISYQYDPNAEIHLRHEVIHTESRWIIYLSLQKRSKLYEIDDYMAFREFIGSYNDKLGEKRDTLNLLHSIILRKNDIFYFQFSYPKSDKSLLILEIRNVHNKKEFYYDISLHTGTIGNQNLVLKDENGLPILKPYLDNKSSFTIETLSDDLVYTYLYKRDFEVAEPPMITEPGLINPNLQIDSSFLMITGKLINLEQEGLYFLQSDSSTLIGKGIRVCSSWFPRVGTVEEMINSLRYFSTRAEWTKLNQAVDKKKALDNYWLLVTKSRERAKRVIREYFENVKNTNQFFTNYKEGWKTDRGMVFIIFGKPDEVYRNGNEELWVYEKNAEFPKLKFSFQRVPNLFSRDHYTLVRDKSFQNHWYKAVDLWRKGRNDEI